MSYLLVCCLAVVYFIALNMFELVSSYSIGVGISLLVVAIVYIRFWSTHMETRIDKIEKFLTMHKTKHKSYLIYALANQMDHEVHSTTADILDKEKHRAYFIVVTALYFNHITKARNHVEQLKSESYRAYYRAAILLREGNIEEADRIISEMKGNWMKYALLAEREQKVNNVNEAIDYAKKAKRKSRGLNRYLLHKIYERQFGLDVENEKMSHDPQTPMETMPLVNKRSNSMN